MAYFQLHYHLVLRTYSTRDKEMIINYIKNQKEHHKEYTTVEELMHLYDENQIEYDPKFIQY